MRVEFENEKEKRGRGRPDTRPKGRTAHHRGAGGRERTERNHKRKTAEPSENSNKSETQATGGERQLGGRRTDTRQTETDHTRSRGKRAGRGGQKPHQLAT